MGRENRLACKRAAFFVVLLGWVSVTVGCGALLGIDDGVPYGSEASTRDTAPGKDAASAETTPDVGDEDAGIVADTGSGEDQVSAPDSAEEADAPAEATLPDAPSEACTPDLTFCQNRCKPGTDSCGVYWDCTGSCAPGEGCTPDGRCICAPDPNWCADRCGVTKDNCGNSIDCMGCEGGVACTNGACGCAAESNSAACGANQCGAATNNCKQSVNCGVNGTTGCAAGQTCLTGATANTCCTLGTCTGRCNASISDNCGGTLTCPTNGCPAGQVCDLATTSCCIPQNTCGNQCNVAVSDGCGGKVQCACSAGTCGSNNQCCVPNGTCSGSCLDNCGQQSQACCGKPDAGMDEGAPPMCLPRGSPCSTPEPCCPGLTCLLFRREVTPNGAGGGSLPDGPVILDSSTPTCQ